MSQTLTIPEEILKFWKSRKVAEREIAEAAVVDLVWRKKISRQKGAELLGVNIWDLPKLLVKHGIPWFDYSPDDVADDLKNLKGKSK